MSSLILHGVIDKYAGEFVQSNGADYSDAENIKLPDQRFLYADLSDAMR
jgi:hypothetical protein